MARRKKVETHFTAELTPIIVYDGDKQVGYGYLLVREDGREIIPILCDANNNELPNDVYNIFPVMEKRVLVVVAANIQ